MKLVWINIHYRYHINPIHTSLYIPYWYGSISYQYPIHTSLLHHEKPCYTNVEMNITGSYFEVHNGWFGPLTQWRPGGRSESPGTNVESKEEFHRKAVATVLDWMYCCRLQVSWDKVTTSNIENWEMTGPCKWCMYMIAYVYIYNIYYTYDMHMYMYTYDCKYYIYMYIIVYTIITHTYIYMYIYTYTHLYTCIRSTGIYDHICIIYTWNIHHTHNCFIYSRLYNEIWFACEKQAWTGAYNGQREAFSYIFAVDPMHRSLIFMGSICVLLLQLVFDSAKLQESQRAILTYNSLGLRTATT